MERGEGWVSAVGLVPNSRLVVLPKQAFAREAGESAG